MSAHPRAENATKPSAVTASSKAMKNAMKVSSHIPTTKQTDAITASYNWDGSVSRPVNPANLQPLAATASSKGPKNATKDT